VREPDELACSHHNGEDVQAREKADTRGRREQLIDPF